MSFVYIVGKQKCLTSVVVVAVAVEEGVVSEKKLYL